MNSSSEQPRYPCQSPKPSRLFQSTLSHVRLLRRLRRYISFRLLDPKSPIPLLKEPECALIIRSVQGPPLCHTKFFPLWSCISSTCLHPKFLNDYRDLPRQPFS